MSLAILAETVAFAVVLGVLVTRKSKKDTKEQTRAALDAGQSYKNVNNINAVTAYDRVDRNYPHLAHLGIYENTAGINEESDLRNQVTQRNIVRDPTMSAAYHLRGRTHTADVRERALNRLNYTPKDTYAEQVHLAASGVPVGERPVVNSIANYGFMT